MLVGCLDGSNNLTNPAASASSSQRRPMRPLPMLGLPLWLAPSLMPAASRIRADQPLARNDEPPATFFWDQLQECKNPAAAPAYL